MLANLIVVFTVIQLTCAAAAVWLGLQLFPGANAFQSFAFFSVGFALGSVPLAGYLFKHSKFYKEL